MISVRKAQFFFESRWDFTALESLDPVRETLAIQLQKLLNDKKTDHSSLLEKAL